MMFLVYQNTQLQEWVRSGINLVAEFSIWGVLGKLKQFKLYSGCIFFDLFPELLVAPTQKSGLLCNSSPSQARPPWHEGQTPTSPYF